MKIHSVIGKGGLTSWRPQALCPSVDRTWRTWPKTHDELLDLYKTNKAALLRLCVQGSALDNVAEAVLGQIVEAQQDNAGQAHSKSMLQYAEGLLEAYIGLIGGANKVCDGLHDHITLCKCYTDLSQLRQAIPAEHTIIERKKWCVDHSRTVASLHVAYSSCKAGEPIPRLSGLLENADGLAGNEMKKAFLEQWWRCIEMLDSVMKKGRCWKSELGEKPTWEQVKKAAQALTTTLGGDLKNAHTAACKDSSLGSVSPLFSLIPHSTAGCSLPQWFEGSLVVALHFGKAV